MANSGLVPWHFTGRQTSRSSSVQISFRNKLQDEINALHIVEVTIETQDIGMFERRRDDSKFTSQSTPILPAFLHLFQSIGCVSGRSIWKATERINVLNVTML